ncbi:MATE family efflux transporter [Mucilaginibacter ginsenosidivorax]|uniref:Multidrug-efflux transporter n=1 Tax=Mucilaginibacter ginsenosidivorax TaxID=862126 RepID=A0A5B8W8W5_9SPHI|nr:MATE family efflux transporter [Mucilaginibacter ginsenosidivorax]QEC80121.1 MATE family efflux transporter [Mucilaginibacter ginsenosidivorax]
MKAIYHKYRPFYSESLKLAIPVMISQLGHIMVQISDSIIIGHFTNKVSLAAVSLVNSLFMIPLVVGMGISYGLTPLIAQNNARKDFKECGLLLSNSLMLNLLTGIALFSAIYFGTLPLIGHLGQAPSVVKAATPYLFLLSLSIIPLLIFNTFKQFAEGLGFTKQAMKISIWGNVINICLGIIFVKGLFGIHPMGIKGVGYSTLIDRCVMAVVMSFYVFKSPIFKGYLKSFAIKNIDRLRGLQILKIGAPVALQYIFEVSAFGGASILIGTIGVNQQAAHLVALNLASATYMMATGVSAAAAIKSGNYFGVSDHKNLRLAAISNYHIVLILMGITAVIFAVGRNYLPWIITSDKDVIIIASQLLIIAAFFQLFDGTQVVGLGVLRGMGDVNIPTFITFLAYWVGGLPIGYLLGIKLKMGVYGVWYGLVLGLAIASVLLFWRFNLISKRHRDTTVPIFAKD